jgi:hypothetical protein
LIKNKIQPFLVYKKCTTLSKTSTGLKWKDEVRIYKHIEPESKQE